MGLGSWAKRQARKAARAVSDAAEAVTDVAAEAAKAVGNAVEGAGNAAGDLIGNNRWGDSVKHFVAVVGSSLKGLLDSMGAAASATIRFAAVLTVILPVLEPELVTDAIKDLVRAAKNTLATGVIGAAHAFQGVFTLLDFETYPVRRLTRREEAWLKRALKGSLNYDVIRVVVDSANPVWAGDRSVVIGNTIYLGTWVGIEQDRKYDGDVKGRDFHVLLHECAHVWQYQNRGSAYLVDAVHAQGFVKDEYLWEREINVRNRRHWRQLNAEAQAQFVEDLWEGGELWEGSVDQAGTIEYETEIGEGYESSDEGIGPMKTVVSVETTDLEKTDEVHKSMKESRYTKVGGHGRFFDADWQRSVGRFVKLRRKETTTTTTRGGATSVVTEVEETSRDYTDFARTAVQVIRAG